MKYSDLMAHWSQSEGQRVAAIKIRIQIPVGCKGFFMAEMRPGAQVGIDYKDCPEGRKLTGVNV